MKKLLLVLFACIFAACCSQKKEGAYRDGDTITVTGVVSLVGNEPFTHPVVRPADGKEPLFLPDAYKKEKSFLFGKTVTVKGDVKVKMKRTVDNKITVYEYRLTPDKITDEKGNEIK